MSAKGLRDRVSARFGRRFHRYYAREKIRNDNIYEAVAARLRGRDAPLFDIGCGIGILEIYLRELGFDQPMTGIDHDEEKIAVARSAAGSYPALDFRVADARTELPRGVDVVALDVMHYFTPEEQQRILQNIMRAIPPGGFAIFRDAVNDDSLRFRLTHLQERFSRRIRWLKAERLQFLTRDELVGPFAAAGYSIEVMPLWSWMPYNNYLFVFRRPGSGITNS